MAEADFPSNSISSRMKRDIEGEPATEVKTSKTVETETKTVKKVAEGKVTSRPKPLTKRFKSMFFEEFAEGYTKHLVESIVIPKTKDMIYTLASQMVDAVKEGFEEALFGPQDKDKTERRRFFDSDRPTRITNYNSRYRSSNSSSRRREDRPPVGRNRSVRSGIVRDVFVETRRTGEKVLAELEELIMNPEYQHCTVGDFYALVGEPVRPVDEEWGWTDLRRARVVMMEPDEYLIEMPPPRAIDAV